MIAYYLNEAVVVQSMSESKIKKYIEDFYKEHPPTEQSKRKYHHLSPAPADLKEILSAKTGEIPSKFQDIKAFFCKDWFVLGRVAQTDVYFMPKNNYYQKIHVYFYKEEDDSWYTSGFALLDGLVIGKSCPLEEVPFLYRNLILAVKLMSHCRTGREARDLLHKMVQGKTSWKPIPEEV